MSGYTIIVFIIFLLITMYLGYLGYKNTKSSQDYLLAGRKTHPLIMALSYGATFISTSAIVGFGGLAANMGMGLLWLTFFNVFIGIFIAFVFFGKRTRRMGKALDAHTFSELLGKRFESKFIQGFAAVLIFLFMPIYAASVIKGGANFVQTYFGIPYSVSLLAFVAVVAIYVWMGGMKGVMYTDAFQAGIMFIAMVVLLVTAYANLGGVTSAHIQLSELFSNPVIQEDIAKSVAGGFQGWTSMPKSGSPMWWSLISTIVLGVGIGVLAQPQLAVRFMTVKSDKELNRAVLSGGIFIFSMTGVAFIVGALANVLLFQKTGQIAIVAANGVNDNIIPLFIKNFLPEWFSSIFLVAMLAAAMSTLSAQFHTMGSAAGRDLYEKTLERKGNSLVITKSATLVVILISTAIAWAASGLPIADGIIAKFTTIFFELTTAAFLPVYVAALFFKSIPKAAVKGAMISGSATWFFWTFFVHSNASYMQICKLLTGKASIVMETSLEKLSMVGTTFIALPVSTIVMLLVWLAYAKTGKSDLDSKHINKCFGSM
ncbi:sodium:solute symporter family protein [Ruminiclostridium herbifermentans]|uniref:Sodium:solute symporter family protein n=1 Tax=Ruminiclostridium herbifermentans TaxID=2488810 RepID=A0A4U7JH07_9FIRM|nr:sodium:solute symporter family protein [Ruminiclostridium herbifermentans]QNU67390.1 sodium:solute symporter family protein [Ruminiclostridium herbifermentans]